LIPDAPVVPDGKLKSGKENIDGITYVFEKVANGEVGGLVCIDKPPIGLKRD
jgi:hypothetical protein